MATSRTQPRPRNYTFCGSILRFGRPVKTNWRTTTVAASEKQARNNLKFRAKKMLKLGASAAVELEGKFQVGNEVFLGPDFSSM